MIATHSFHLRAVTGPDDGRIFAHAPVEAVQRIAGTGTGDTRRKVPGGLDLSTGLYNPRASKRSSSRNRAFGVRSFARCGPWRRFSHSADARLVHLLDLRNHPAS